jgi:succinate-semialdehyde dehydrogenase/glutarate-semialdehyde dehydrogenase
MDALIGDATNAGATLKAGGARMGNQGFFWEPTVISDVPLSARIMNEEPFGPVAIMNPFKTFDEVVEQANRLPYGLAAYAFTQSSKRSMLIGDALEAGMVAINNVSIAAADSPFGGVKDSGHGSEDGPEGVEACQVIKSISMA